MKYPYIVNKGGTWYPAGTEVPDDKQKEPENSIKYKKSDITQMKVEDLKKLAAELEIEGAEDATGDNLKEAIIAKLGL